MLKKHLYLILFAIAVSFSPAFSQEHNLRSTSLCRLVKKPINFNYEGATPCSACKKITAEETVARKKEDAIRAQAEAEAYKKKVAEKRKKDLEERLAAAALEKEKEEAGRVSIGSAAVDYGKMSKPANKYVKYEVVRAQDLFKLPDGGTMLCTVKADGKVLFSTSQYRDISTTGVPGYFVGVLPSYRNGCEGDKKNVYVILNAKGQTVTIDGRSSFGYVGGKDLEKSFYTGAASHLNFTWYTNECESYTPDNYIQSKRRAVEYFFHPPTGKITSEEIIVYPMCPCN